MSGHPRRGRPGPFHRRLLPIVAVLCVVMTTGACNPLDVLHYLAGCKDGSSSSSSASSSTVASTAKGEWTKLIGKTEGEIKRMWPDYVTPCSGYNIVYGGSGLQCTWWACMRQRALGHDLGQGSWGDGGMWGASAKAHGWKQGAKAGGIAQFPALITHITKKHPIIRFVKPEHSAAAGGVKNRLIRAHFVSFPLYSSTSSFHCLLASAAWLNQLVEICPRGHWSR